MHVKEYLLFKGFLMISDFNGQLFFLKTCFYLQLP